MAPYFYATFDPRADLDNGNRGFLNTVEVCRFLSRADRDAFVQARANQMAEAVTRDGAIKAFAATYHSTGDEPPRGGLMGDLVEWIEHEEAPGETASAALY